MSGPDPSAWGVLTTYRDYRGALHEAPAETVEQILAAMGAGTQAPPPASVRVIARDEPFSDDRAVAVELEDGGREKLTGGHLPPGLPFGYHSLIDADGSSSPLIVSPDACFLPRDLRVWGWAVQLYSARSRASWGIGDLHDLATLGRWARSEGAGVLLVNPLAAVAPGLPQQASPYSAGSRCFLNPLYLSVEDLPEARDAEGTERDDAVERGRRLNAARLVERDAILHEKMQALRARFDLFEGSPVFERYLTERGLLLRDFATYSALAESYGADRSSWPHGFEHPGAPRVAEWRDAHRRLVTFHEWLQWHLDEQLAAAQRTIALIHDLPVGVDPGGADTWMWQDAFAPGIGVGAPPDELSVAGQGWGLAAFDPWKLRAAGYEPFIQTIRAALRRGSGVRIDHVMGLFRLFWIPEGMPPSAGTYVRYPARDLLGILALESHRAGALVVGEDLGTVEAEVREEMSRRDMLSYRVMWFEEGAPRDYPELALATVTNHDLPTIAGVWTGSDAEEQRRVLPAPNPSGTEAMWERLQALTGCAGDAPIEQVIAAAYGQLSEASSKLVIATLEDALGVTARPNMPGTTDERPNWSRPLPLPIEALDGQDLVRRIAGILSQGRKGSGEDARNKQGAAEVGTDAGSNEMKGV